MNIPKLSAASTTYQGSNPYAVFKPKWCTAIGVLGVTTMLTHIDLGRQVCPQ